MNPKQFRYDPRRSCDSCHDREDVPVPVRRDVPGGTVRGEAVCGDDFCGDDARRNVVDADPACSCCKPCGSCCPMPESSDPGLPTPAVLPRMPAAAPLAASYVPMQELETVYSPEEALTRGTLFPSLDLPFRGTTIGGCRRV